MLTESESSWIEAYLRPRHPDLVPAYIEARGIVSSALAQGRLGTNEANRLVEFASSSRMPLGENVAGMIGELAGTFSEAQKALKRLADGRELHCRINALAALDSFPWSDVHNELTGRLLRDKSAKVRALAASKALGSGMSSLVPLLDEAISRESNEKLRAELEWNRDLLRDGCIVKAQDNGRVSVTCRKDGGVVSTSFGASEFDSKGKEWIASQRR